MIPFGDDHLPVVMGHRGVPVRAPENTAASFALAAAEGATWVELDARLAADGVVVHHDARTADGTPVVDQTVADLQGKGVVSLAGILDGLPDGLGVDVEVKNLPGQPGFDESGTLTGQVIDALHPRQAQRAFMTSSFHPATVRALALGLPDVTAGQLMAETTPIPMAVDVANEHMATVLCPPVVAHLDASTVDRIHAAGLAVLVWTVDDPDRARELAEAGVDALCTNDPAAIVQALS